MTIALYPGSFDPVTNGHVDIATRAANVFDELVIGIFATPQKNILFTVEERVKLMEIATAHIPNVRIELYTGLTVEFARRLNSKVIIRGLRMSPDFEHEFEMGLMNKTMAPEIETFCLMASVQFQFLSSSLIKEVVQLNGNIDDLVPQHVLAALKEKMAIANMPGQC